MSKLFVSTYETGDLYLSEILIQVDFPIVFICKNDLNDNFLFYKHDEITNEDHWIVTRLDTNDIIELKTNRKSLDSVFHKSKLNKLYYISYDFVTDNTKCEVESVVREGIFEEKDLYIGDSIYDDTYVQDSLRYSSNTGRAVLDIIVNPNTDMHSIDVLVFEKIANSIRLFFRALGNSHKLYLSPQKGSTVLRFFTDEETALLKQYDTEKSINKLVDILSSEDFSNIETIIMESPSILSSYKKTLDSLNKLDNSVKFVSSTPSKSIVRDETISKKHIAKMKKFVENIRIEQKTPFEYIGETHAVDIDKRTIKFITEDDKVIKGVLDESLKRDYKVICNYRFYGEKTFKIDGNNKEFDTKYLIAKIEDI